MIGLLCALHARAVRAELRAEAAEAALDRAGLPIPDPRVGLDLSSGPDRTVVAKRQADGAVEELPAKVACDACAGRGRVLTLVGSPKGSRMAQPLCSICLGAGRIGAEAAAWRAVGRAHRDARVACGLSLVSRALQLGVLPRELNDMEQGRLNPARLETAKPPAP